MKRSTAWHGWMAVIAAALLAGCGGRDGNDASGATTFSKSYGGSRFDEARAVAPTADGGYVFVGGVDGDRYGRARDLWINKLDANGNVEWQRAIGGRSSSDADRVRRFNAVRQTADGGFIVAGRASDPPDLGGLNPPEPTAAGDDVWIAKLSAAGLIEWQREHDSGAWAGFAFAAPSFGRGEFADDEAIDVWPAPDGGYVLAGTSRANIVERDGGTVFINVLSVLVLRLDAQGQLLWQRRLADGQFVKNGNLFVVTPIVRPTADNGAVLAYTRNFGDGFRMRVTRFGPGGEIHWQTDDEDVNASDLMQTDDAASNDQTADGNADDGFVLTAFSTAFGGRAAPHVNLYSIVLKLDGGGNRQWRRVFGEGDAGVTLRAIDQACVPRPNDDGVDCDFVVSGSHDDGSFKPLVAYVARLAASGSTLAERHFDEPSLRFSDAGDGFVFDAAREATVVHDVRGSIAGDSILAVTGVGPSGHRLVLDGATLATLVVSDPFQLAVNVGSVGEPDFVGGTPQIVSANEIVVGNSARQEFSVHLSSAPLSGSLERPRRVLLARNRGDDAAVAVVEVARGTYIVAGVSNSFDDTSSSLIESDNWVVGITNGQVNWQRRYDAEHWGTVRSMAPSGDGGVVVALYRGGANRLLKLTASGDVAWQSPRLGSFDAIIDLGEVRAVPGGGHVVIGNSNIEGAGNRGHRRSVVYRLDAGGALQWQRSFEDLWVDSIRPIDGDGDGERDDGFVVSGLAPELAGGLARVIRLDAQGETVWARSYSVAGASTAWPHRSKIEQAANGGIVVGLTESAAFAPDALGQPFGQSNLLLIKLDLQGAIVWSRSYGAFLDERLYDLHALSDGGLIVAGASDSLGERSEAWLLRLGPDGLLAPGCNAFLGSLPAAAFKVDAFEVVQQLDEVELPDTPPEDIVVTDTQAPSASPETAEARQCVGRADAAGPLPPSAQPLTLTLVQPGSLIGVVTSTPAGLICGTDGRAPPCSAEFPADGDVFLGVDPGSVSRFLRWEDCAEVLPPDNGGAPRCRVRMDRDRSVRAVFGAAQDRFQLRVSIVGRGTIRSSDEGIACGAFYGAGQDCDHLYDRLIAGTNLPTSITLAVFTHAADFQGWGGDCAAFGTESVFSLTMDSDKQCSATFSAAPSTFDLAVEKSGTGSGLVISAPAGISCGGDCVEAFGVGETVRLLAVEDDGSAFDGWSGCDRIVPPPSGAIPVCEVDINASRSVGAAFTREIGAQYLLEMRVIGSDGIVESSDRGIVCAAAGPDCQQLYQPGASIGLSYNLLRAAGAFQGWGGDCAAFGLALSPRLVMDGHKRCTAQFSSPS